MLSVHICLPVFFFLSANWSYIFTFVVMKPQKGCSTGFETGYKPVLLDLDYFNFMIGPNYNNNNK